MRAGWVHIERDFAAPVDRVFSHLAEHENLAEIFGAKITRVCDGTDGHRNGVGSTRRLAIGPLPGFEERVDEYVEHARIVYRISGGVTPLRGHVGIQEFSATPSGGTHLDYRIRIASPIPGLAPIVRAGLDRSVRAGLDKVDAALR